MANDESSAPHILTEGYQPESTIPLNPLALTAPEGDTAVQQPLASAPPPPPPGPLKK